jgi:hypothetical protein
MLTIAEPADLNLIPQYLDYIEARRRQGSLP